MTESVKSFHVPATPSHVGLAAEPAFGTDLAGNARHFAGERVELVHHRVDGFLQLQDFAGNVHGDFLRQVAAGDGGRNVGDVADLRREVQRHEVDAVGQVFPRAGDARHLRLTAELAFGADLAGHAGHFRGKRIELVHHRVDGVFEFENFAAHIDGDLARQVAAGHRRGHVRDVAHLVGEVAAHGVDRVGQVLPGAGDAGHDRLAAELAVGADFAGDAGDFRGERAQLIDHRVDGFLELQNFAAHVDGDLFRQVAVGHRDRHLGDVANLRGQVRGHRVDALGEVFPHAGHFAHLRLAAELALGADFAGDARHLGGEHVELLDHRVDDLSRAQELALQRPAVDVERDGAQQIALRHGGDGARHFGRRPKEIVDQRIDRGFHLAPGALGKAEAHALAGLALPAHHLPDALKLLCHALVGGDDFVEGIGDLAHDADPVPGHPDREVADTHGLKRMQKFLQIQSLAAVEIRRSGFGERSGSSRGRGAVFLCGTCYVGSAGHGRLRVRIARRRRTGRRRADLTATASDGKNGQTASARQLWPAPRPLGRNLPPHLTPLKP